MCVGHDMCECATIITTIIMQRLIINVEFLCLHGRRNFILFFLILKKFHSVRVPVYGIHSLFDGSDDDLDNIGHQTKL